MKSPILEPTTTCFRRWWHPSLKDNRCTVRLILCAATLPPLFAGALLAQEPASALSDLRTRARAGDRIEVAVSDGSILKGEYELSNDSLLRMRLKGRSQDISAATITSMFSPIHVTVQDQGQGAL